MDLRFPTATDLAYWVWAFVGLMVAVGAWANLFARKDFRPGVRLMYFGLALAWTGDSANKWWFGTRRLLDFPTWMLDHVSVLAISVLTIAGALIHIHTFTASTSGNVGWLTAFVVSVLAAAAMVFAGPGAN